MKIIGFNPMTEEQRAAAERPAKTARWYDRQTRSWVVQTLNLAGDQIGDATYVHGKADAIREEERRQEEIDKANAGTSLARPAIIRNAGKMTPDQFKSIRTDLLALTQAELAGLLGISRPYLSQIETGQRVIHHQIGLLMLAFQSGFRPLGWPRDHARTESRAKAPQRVN